jgi:cysteine-rich CPXCG protein
MEQEAVCPYCGELVSIWLEDAGGDQRYVEDCPVCCRPWQVSVWRDHDGELHAVIAHQDE